MRYTIRELEVENNSAGQDNPRVHSAPVGWTALVNDLGPVGGATTIRNSELSN